MSRPEPDVPRPRRRLWRTLLKRPRNIRRFAPRLLFSDVAAPLPDPEELSHWGQVVLVSDSAVAMHRDGTATRLFHLVTMPYGDQELSEWDEVVREFDRRKALATIRRAVVHLPDGRQRKAKRVSVSLDAHRRAVHLTFAPLRPGVVLEFEEQYDHFTPPEVAAGLWDQVFLRGPAPCRRLRYTVAVAPPFELCVRWHHCELAPRQTEEHGYRVFRWELENTPGIEIDHWTPPPRDFVPWVDVSTLASWKPVARYYSKELVPSGPASPALRRLHAELTAGAHSSWEQASAIYRYTTRDVRYGRHPHELTLESPREAGRMLEDLRGDCKDKSALMVSLLRESNIPASIALVLTRMNGQTPFLPGARFDHALVRTEVDGRTLWLDAAGGPYTFGDVPLNDQGVAALILDGDGSTLGQVPPARPEEHCTRRTCRGRLDEDGTYRFTAEACYRGEPAVVKRLALLDRSDEHRRRTVMQYAAADLTGAAVSDIQLHNLDDLSRDVAFAYAVVLARWARRIEDLLLLRIPWLEPLATTGPLSARERTEPLIAPAVSSLVEEHDIGLPPGFGGYGLPFVAEHQSAWGRYACRIEVADGRLHCRRTIEYLGGIVPPHRFADFKAYWEACAQSDAADVVLMKSSG